MLKAAVLSVCIITGRFYVSDNKQASTESRTLQVIAGTLGVELYDLNKDADLTEKFGADSLDYVELGDNLDGEFNIDLPHDLGARAKTVGQIILLVKKYEKEKIGD